MEPDIKLDGTSIKVANEAKILGLVFYHRLTFRAHVKYLKTVCDKALNMLRVVGHTDWGADKVVLLRLYCALVRSKLDYGCIVYGSASKSVLRTLDAVQHAGLHICLGAFRTSPVESLYVKAGETSLSLRRLRLAVNYVLKLYSIPENPAYNNVVNPKFLSQFEAQPHITPTLGIRLQPHFQAAEIDVEGISTDSLLTGVSPWCMPVPVVRFDLTISSKKLKLTPNNINNYFLNCLLLIPSTVRFLLMVLNVMKRLLQQRLQMATFKVLHCVGSLTIALFILLNCMPLILPLDSSASLRKSPSWCCLILCFKIYFKW